MHMERDINRQQTGIRCIHAITNQTKSKWNINYRTHCLAVYGKLTFHHS